MVLSQPFPPIPLPSPSQLPTDGIKCRRSSLHRNGRAFRNAQETEEQDPGTAFIFLDSAAKGSVLHVPCCTGVEDHVLFLQLPRQLSPCQSPRKQPEDSPPSSWVFTLSLPLTDVKRQRAARKAPAWGTDASGVTLCPHFSLQRLGGFFFFFVHKVG